MSKMELSWVAVSDLDKAVDFYTNVVGLEIKEKHDLFGWAELQGKDGGARLGLAQMEDQDLKPGSNAVVTLTVPDIEAARADLEAKGCTLIGEIQDIPTICRLQMIADKDGNLMQLYQRES
jgi:predicted enzyme related to lactoylglutathione lyase